ncbi:Heterokaryon incompatibility [Fusarium oxysporum f. sp. vasinfectum]|nr:Heterokaryon incompatibility [Fusarium oxysporum f. sp. vasinfectum]
MRLINTTTLQLESFSSTKAAPPYAILSHTWGKDEDEVSLREMTPNVRITPTAGKHGFWKIEKTCRLARDEYALEYAWVDTCCIDKSSSAELSEAINSMFKWYQQAAVCFAFLADWPSKEQSFGRCRWWTRGWTLQELVASESVVFYDMTWQARGNKSTLCPEIARVSGISTDVLTSQKALSEVPVAVRMSWAAQRTTTREEDMAYCLLGLFDVNMPMLYGEGRKAFQRLQEEIIKESPDMSIFAWKTGPDIRQDYMGILAPSPKEFSDASRLYPTLSEVLLGPIIELSISNRGVQFVLPCHKDQSTDGYFVMPVLHYDIPFNSLASNMDVSQRRISYGVCLRMIGTKDFVRALPDRLVTYPLEAAGMEAHGFMAVKSLSAQNSGAVGRRAIRFRNPRDLQHPNLGLASVEPQPSWIQALGTLQANQRDYFIAYLHFEPGWANEFSSFTLICRFRNPRGSLLSPGFWQCDLERTDEFSARRNGYYITTHDYALSGHDDAQLPASKVLELLHLDGEPKTKRVVLTLQRELRAESADHQFFIHLRVEDGE